MIEFFDTTVLVAAMLWPRTWREGLSLRNAR
jgi:hypothetical protein